MLNNSNIVAFAPTSDFEKAKAFYVGLLGLRLVSNDNFAMVLDSNGVMLRVSMVGPDFKPLPFTILGWEVSDIESIVPELKNRGVAFEHFGFPDQDALGIWTAPSGDKVAWFKDPDGNILSVSQHTPETA
jgi:catechol 2,3-dioxygenase-like lactoylglutathione lyase family enzyme